MNNKARAARHPIWVENMNVCVIPSRMGRDVFMIYFCLYI